MKIHILKNACLCCKFTCQSCFTQKRNIRTWQGFWEGEGEWQGLSEEPTKVKRMSIEECRRLAFENAHMCEYRFFELIGSKWVEILLDQENFSYKK